MIKVKLRRDKLAVRKLTSKLKKTANPKNFTKPAKIFEEEIKRGLRGELSNDIAKILAGSLDAGNFNHLYKRRLIKTVDTEVKKTIGSGFDPHHTIHIGYITELPHAARFEEGGDSQNISLQRVLQWMDTKPNFKGLATHEKYAIANSIKARISDPKQGPHAYPIVQEAWEKHQDQYIDEVIENIENIWKGA